MEDRKIGRVKDWPNGSCSEKVRCASQEALVEVRADVVAQERGRQMAAILQELAELPEPIAIEDPVAWQIEQRRERRL